MMKVIVKTNETGLRIYTVRGQRLSLARVYLERPASSRHTHYERNLTAVGRKGAQLIEKLFQSPHVFDLSLTFTKLQISRDGKSTVEELDSLVQQCLYEVFDQDVLMVSSSS